MRIFFKLVICFGSLFVCPGRTNVWEIQIIYVQWSREKRENSEVVT